MENTPRYTTIIHEVRIGLDLSCNEYCVADIIYHLSNNPSAKVAGWCYASKETISQYMGVNKKSVHSIINSLINKGLIIKDEQTKWLKSTELWYNKVVIERIKMSDREESSLIGKKGNTHREESSLQVGKKGNTINISNNNKYKKEKNIKKEIFNKPSLKDLESYIVANKLNADSEGFMDYYEEREWKVKHGTKLLPMKDWHRALRTWSRNGYDKGGLEKTVERLAKRFEQAVCEWRDAIWQEFYPEQPESIRKEIMYAERRIKHAGAYYSMAQLRSLVDCWDHGEMDKAINILADKNIWDFLEAKKP